MSCTGAGSSPCRPTRPLREHLDAGPVTFYVGFDPTAPSLHFGNLVQLIVARHLQAAGHRPLLLVGGSTGLIGDPKDTGERVLNCDETVADWVEPDPRPGRARTSTSPARPPPGSSTTSTGPGRCRPWTSFATSASTSP